jgi:3-methyl-2-oxobutanoate hydroxymethyltransferase
MAVGTSGAGAVHKITVPDIRAKKGTDRIVAVTAYDVIMARLVDEAGVDVVLVGDSLGMVVQGRASTLAVTLDEMCYHGRAVARAGLRAHLVGDMPFMSYQVSVAKAVASAGRLVKEGSFESVKLEGGEEIADRVRQITRIGIPVMGHVGMQPQSVHAYGGFKVQGRGAEASAKIVSDARALEAAGVYSIVVESVPAEVAARVTRAVSVPTIGIGAGAECDGQVLVCTDLLGLSLDRSPKFVKRYAELGQAAIEAVRHYAGEVRSGTFPSREHTYRAEEPIRAVEPGAPEAGRAAGGVKPR